MALGAALSAVRSLMAQEIADEWLKKLLMSIEESWT